MQLLLTVLGPLRSSRPLLMPKEESDHAIADFDRAIAINPMATIYLNRGLARSQKSDFDGAITDFDKALSLDPKLADAYNARGLARYYKEELDRSIADYDKAIGINPSFAEAYENRAISLITLHRFYGPRRSQEVL
jgi:lipoprotein NlpI